MSTYSVRGEKLKKENKTAVEEQTAVKKDELDLQLDQQIQKAENTTGAAIDAVDANYRSAVDSAAVQRELDRRQIRETMANMGLGRSGLNATQQTAVQLSAGNKQAAAALQRQAAVDSLKQSLAEYKIASEDARRQGKLALDETAQKGIAEYDASVDKWVSEAESTEYKAQQEAATEAMKQQYKLVQDEQERVSKSNQKVLDKMYEDGEIPKDMYIRAVSKGWTVNEAETVKNYIPYMQQAKAARENGYSKEDGITADDVISSVLALYMDETISDSAKDYLLSIAGIPTEEVNAFIELYKTTN